jgi:hypothetical protein
MLKVGRGHRQVVLALRRMRPESKEPPERERSQTPHHSVFAQAHGASDCATPIRAQSRTKTTTLPHLPTPRPTCPSLAHWHRRTPIFFSCMSRFITRLTSERLPFSPHTHAHIYIYTYIYIYCICIVYIYIYIQYMHAWMNAYIHTYCTYINPYIHTYLYIHKCVSACASGRRLLLPVCRDLC